MTRDSTPIARQAGGVRAALKEQSNDFLLQPHTSDSVVAEKRALAHFTWEKSAGPAVGLYPHSPAQRPAASPHS